MAQSVLEVIANFKCPRCGWSEFLDYRLVSSPADLKFVYRSPIFNEFALFCVCGKITGFDPYEEVKRQREEDMRRKLIEELIK